MAYIPTAPVFADRYRFEPVPKGWDTGRTGYTYLVYDLEKKRLGVIKRADVTSEQAVSHLINEISALKLLKGPNIPKVYETGQAIYDSRKYEYVVIEYTDSLRVEENLDSLDNVDRAEILEQLFRVLDRSHKRGVVNGDVDLKHMFWDREKRRLTVIDWGNAKLSVDPRKKVEFAYDLARAAEILYSLVAGQTPPAIGSIALPDDSALLPGLSPVPSEFHNLCKWAPRTPTTGVRSPHTAAELLEVTEKWREAVQKEKPYRQKRSFISRPIFILLFFIVFLVVIGAILFSSPNIIPPSKTSEPIIHNTETSLPVPSTATNAETSKNTETPTLLSVELSPTPTQNDIPNLETPHPPKTYSPVLVFDEKLVFNDTLKEGCWANTMNGSSSTSSIEGFSRRSDNYWRFEVPQYRNREDIIQTDFSGCLNIQQLTAISMNVWVSKIEANREFGFFIEDTNGNRRAYTIWLERVEGVNKMYLRVWENNDFTDYELLFTRNLKVEDAFPRLYYQFSFLSFFEINNDGLDILYLDEGKPQEPVSPKNIDPNSLIRIDNAVRPTLGNIKAFGLVGYGGELKTAFWPLVFSENK